MQRLMVLAVLAQPAVTLVLVLLPASSALLDLTAQLHKPQVAQNAVLDILLLLLVRRPLLLVLFAPLARMLLKDLLPVCLVLQAL